VLRRLFLDHGVFEICRWNQLPRRQIPSKAEFSVGVGKGHSQAIDVGASALEIGARLLDGALHDRGVKADQHLSFLDDGIEIGAERLDRPVTWLPTSTVVTASTVPVAAIAFTIGPRVTGAVTTSGAA